MSCVTAVHDFYGTSCQAGALCVAYQAKAKTYFLFVQGMIKQLLALASEISRMFKVSVRIIWLSLWLRLITLIILDIAKPSSNRC